MPITRIELGRLLAEHLPPGEPDLVIVDRRSLELIMGDLAQLLILGDVNDDAMETAAARKMINMDEEPYVWETDRLCPICQEPLAHTHICQEA